jgi:hypothetical protein
MSELEHLRRMAIVAANEDEDALLWVLAEIERLAARNAELLAALEHIYHATSERMLATNHGKRGDIAHKIARAAIAKAKDAGKDA